MKTITEEDAVVLNKEIPGISIKQYNWMLNHFDQYMYVKKREFVCLECSHVFPRKTRMVLGLCRCPNCNKLIKPLPTYPKKHRTREECAYFMVLDTYKRYQVIRHYYMMKKSKAGEIPIIELNEIIQIWIDVEGNSAVLSVPPGSFWNQFSLWGPLRLSRFSSRHRISMDKDFIYPKIKLLPQIKYSGFKIDDDRDNYYDRIFTTILKYPPAEVAWRKKDIELFNIFRDDGKRMWKYWKSYLITKRHKYKIEDINDWLDHLDILTYLKKDIHNPYYICPKNFNEEHTRWVNKKNVVDKKRNLERIKKRLKKDDEWYKNKFKDLIGLKFVGKNVVVAVFESVSEFRIESEILGHCAWTQSYHKKPGALMLSARVDDAPIETIHFDLNYMKIMQSRGFENQNSKFHDEIQKIIKMNIPKIRKAIHH